MLNSIVFVQKLQNKGKIVFSLDGCFGLVRKQSAGLSWRSPLYGDLYFLDQDRVDQYVSDYPKPKPLATVSQLMPYQYFYDALLIELGV